MRLKKYLEARGESEAAFARRAGVSQQAVNDFGRGRHLIAPRGDICLRIIRASLKEPAPNGGTVTLEDLVGELLRRRAGWRKAAG